MEFYCSVADQVFNTCRKRRKGILNRNSFPRFSSISELAVIIIFAANSDYVCLISVYMEIQFVLGVFLVFIASMQVKISHVMASQNLNCLAETAPLTVPSATNWTILPSDIDKLNVQHLNCV